MLAPTIKRMLRKKQNVPQRKIIKKIPIVVAIVKKLIILTIRKAITLVENQVIVVAL